MWLNELWQRWIGRMGRTRSYRRRQRMQTRPRTCLFLESLEDRTVPSTFTVNTTNDTDAVNLTTGQDAQGNVSLRSAIEASNYVGGSNQIALGTNMPFTLNSALPTIATNDNLTITGTGQQIERSTASGTAAFRLFDVASGASLTLDDVGLYYGLAKGTGSGAEGGAIYSSGTLTLSGVTVKSNQAVGSNGANGKVSVIARNGASAAGGGIYVAGGSVTLTNDLISGNSAVGGNGGYGSGTGTKGGSGGVGGSGGNAAGGGLYVAAGSATLSNDSFGSVSLQLGGNSARGGRGGHGGNGPSLVPSKSASNNYGPGGPGGSGGNASGGGLYWAAAGTLTIANDTFSYNEAQGGTGGAGGYHATGGNGGNSTGGGMYVGAGTVNVSNDTLSANEALGGVGGHGGDAGHGNFNAFEPEGNGGPGGNGGNAGGGALYVAGGAVTLNNDSITPNHRLDGTPIEAVGGAGGEGGDGNPFHGKGGVGGLGGNAFGGAIYAAAGTLKLNNDYFYSNAATGGSGGGGRNADGGSGGEAAGGGLYVAGGNVALNADFLSNGQVKGGKGGVYGTGYVHDYGGTGGDGGNAFGGGVYVGVGTVSLSNNTLGNNKVQGGNGTATLYNDPRRLAVGVAGGSGGAAAGGGLYAAAGSLALSNDTIAFNTVQGGNGHFGDGVYTKSGGHAGTKGGLGGNGGNASGGGLYVGLATLGFSNDTISSNTVQGGNGGNGGKGLTLGAANPGGIGGNGGNAGSTYGGGLYVVGGATTLANTLIAQDGFGLDTPGTAGSGKTNGLSGTSGSSAGPDVYGTVSSSDHDLIGNSSGSGGFTTTNGDILNPTSVGLDPKGLQNNGGPIVGLSNSTQVLPTIALVAGSQAINAGDSNAAPGATDERGYARIDGNAIDIGTYEYQATAATTDLAVSGTVASTIPSSGQITYQLTVTNNSSTAQSIVTLADVLPADTTLVSWSVPSGWNSSAPNSGNSGTVSAWIGSLAGDASANFTLVVQINGATPGGTVISNTASVGPITGDPNPANNSITLNVTAPPTTPTGVTAAAVSSSEIDLSWKSDPGAANYTVERCTDDKNWSFLVTTSMTAYDDRALQSNTTYYYQIQASNIGGSSSFSAPVSAITLPTAPTGLTATAVSSTEINLSWNGATNEAYKLYRSLVNDPNPNDSNWQLLYSLGNTTSITDAYELQPNTMYFYAIQAVNAAGGVSSFSNLANTTTLATAPTGLTAIVASSSQINLSWNADSGAGDGYLIERSTNSTSGFTPIGNTATGITTYSDTGLASGITYYYEVSAVNAGGDSAFSNIASAATAPPGTPTGLTAVASGNQIELSWNSDAGATSYTLEWSTNGSNGEVSTSSTSYDVTGLQPGATYSFQIAASNAVGTSPYSIPVYSTTAPPTPTGLTVTGVSSSQINLSWNSAPGATSYTLEGRMDGSSTWQVLTTISGTTYSDSGLQGNTTYDYQIQASNAAGSSPFSAQVSATTAPATPTGLTATVVSNYQIDVSWNSDPGATSYTLERYTVGSNNSNPQTITTTGTSYSDTGLQAGTTYYYTIQASNAIGSSPSSVAVYATTTAVVPAAPTGLTTLVVSSSEIDLTWNSVPNALGYYLSYQEGTSSPQVVALGSQTSFRATGLQSGTTYSFSVWASNTVGSGNACAPVIATTAPVTPTGLTATTGSTASLITNASINVSWNSDPGASGYMLERSLVNDPNPYDSNWQVIANLSGTSYTDTGLNSDTTYYYRVLATYNVTIQGNATSGETSFSGPVSAVSSMTSNEHFVVALYQDFLSRGGSKAELDAWAGLIPYQGYWGVANQIARTPEALGEYTNQYGQVIGVNPNGVVPKMYSYFLNRAADLGGDEYWVSLLRNGGTEEQVIIGLVSSPEFYAEWYSNNYGFVDGLYWDLLHRWPGTNELNGWVGLLNSGASRAQVASDFVNGVADSEFRWYAVDAMFGGFAPGSVYQAFFPNLLERNERGFAVTAAEVSAWDGSGIDLLSMEIDIASSSEFYSLAQNS